jgi:hypothetical protein
MVSTNVFRLKDAITFRLLCEEKSMLIPGAELKPDKYEYGIPVLSKEDGPLRLTLDCLDEKAAHAMLSKLAPNEDKPAEPAEHSTAATHASEEEEDDTLLALEKILSRHTGETPNDDDDDDDDGGDALIQQTLF